MTIQDFVNQARSSKFINEKRYGDISSFNFSRKAFYDGKWNAYTMKARGLFINTRINKIVARGYDKFFNYGENAFVTAEALQKKLVFPLHAYRKENGYLGLISWDAENDTFFFATKSVCKESPYVDTLRNIFLSSNIDHEAVAQYLRHASSTMIVEVIAPQFDPHIIDYGKGNDHLVLLDIVKNDLTFTPLPYSRLASIAQVFSIPVKQYEAWCGDWMDLEALIRSAEDPALQIEGYVIEDKAGFHFKLKTAYYKKWKQYRWQSDKVLAGLMSPDDDPFLCWCAANGEELDLISKSIIERRSLYEGQKDHGA